MKPTRSLPDAWLGRLPRERRLVLASIAILLLLLGAILIYQREPMVVEPPGEPVPVEEPPLKAEASGALSEQPAANPGQPSSSASSAPAEPSPEAAAEVVAAAPEHLTLPLVGKLEIRKLYGSVDETYGDFRLYTAMAYAAQPGQPVLAAAGGTVVAVDEDPVDGLTVLLEHGGGMRTRYAGLGKILVSPGAKVESGAIIGQAGQPPAFRAEMGPHLSFTVLLDDVPLDPRVYLSR